MKRDYLPQKTGFCPRPRVSELLREGLSQNLVSVVAGPGYGKTLAVSDFVQQVHRRVIWMHLAAADNDPQRFWSHFLASVSRELPSLAAKLQQYPFPAHASQYEDIAKLFAREVTHDKQAVLVLDDYQQINTPQIVRIIQQMAGENREHICLILISSEKLPLGSLTSQGGHFRLSMEDLSFTPREVEELFYLHGAAIGQAEAEELVRTTGGWPLVVHLICLRHRDGEEVLAEHTHYQLAAELFQERYYSAYPTDVQKTLVRFSYFSCIPLRLAEQLSSLEQGVTTKLISENIFVDYDYTAGALICQTMYRGFLAQKQLFLEPDEVLATHALMGDWFAERGDYLQAMDCYAHSGKYEAYVHAFLQLPQERFPVERAQAILRQMEELFGDTRQEPLMEYCRGLLEYNNGNLNRAEELLLNLMRRLETKSDRESQLLLGECCLALCDIGIRAGNDYSFTYMKRALNCLPEGSRLRGGNRMAVGNAFAFFLPDNQPGRLIRMTEYFFEYSLYADVVMNGSGYGLEWLFAAEAAYLSEEIEKSEEYAAHAIAKAQITKQRDIICNAYWCLMRICFYYGNTQRAKSYLGQIIAQTERCKNRALLDLRDCAEHWYCVWIGDLDRTRPWAESRIHRGADSLTSARSRLIVACYLMEAQKWAEAEAILYQAERTFGEWVLWQERLITHTLMAQCCQALNRPGEACWYFWQAYEMACNNRVITIFAEMGKGMQKLIDMAYHQEQYPFDRIWLDQIRKKAGSYAKRLLSSRKLLGGAGISSLTLNKREKEILTYLAQGLTREEIAELLPLSLAGVKRYITSIYTKLGAVNRADAVHIAMTAGILDSP